MTDCASSAGPLAGVRIVDFTANMSGPLATMILGDQGAEIIKVEPPEGDTLRHVGPALTAFNLAERPPIRPN